MSIRLILGDCIEKMKDISSASVDCIICDLPYGCLAGGGLSNPETAAKYKAQGISSNTASGCAWDIKINLEHFWEQAKRILKNEHCPVIHFCTTKFGFELYNSNPKWFRYDLVWDKGFGVSFLTANKMPMRSHEMIYVFSKAGAKYNRVDISGDYVGWKVVKKNCSQSSTLSSTQYGGAKKISGEGSDGKRCALSVIQNGNTKKGNHPTQKPEALYRWILERYTSPGDTILDPTFGSGNSVFTAHAMGRHAIGIEKDEGFYNKANSKLAPTNTIV
jgi:site-specific DNA-methyltransferase (adenine-specific)